MALERFYRDEQAILSPPESFVPPTPKTLIALEYAKRAHEGQLRKNGDPFYYHPIEVAQILISWGLGEDEDLIAAALLHDVPEDNETISLEEIGQYFGEGVKKLVDGVTKVDKETAEDADMETHKKISARSFLEPRVALIKIADRLHNMRTLGPMSPEKQQEKSRETLDVYTKLAESLGLWAVKKELEDLSFMYLEPEKYQKIKEEVEEDPRLEENFLSHTISALEGLLAEKSIKGRVITRVNGYWALYRKREKALLRGKTSIDRGLRDINDLVSFRVIVEDLDTCYRTLGIVHKQFGNFVDFDRYDEFVGVNRRVNGYSALQTTLDLSQGAVEIALVTEEMERFNRRGVATLLEKGEQDLEDYVLKSVFSPEGKVMFLPKNATGIDCAINNSHRLGAEAIAVIIDGEQKPLATVVPNASTVDFVVGKFRRAPDPDLLNYCLPSTKAVIMEQLNLASSDELVQSGRQQAERILASRGLLRFKDLGRWESELVFDYSREDIKDIYLMLGSGAIGETEINRWLDERNITKESLGVTTIKLSGSDKAGILTDVSKWISTEGGNVKGLDLKTEGDEFTFLLVVKSLTTEGEDIIRQKVAADDRFQSWKVV